MKNISNVILEVIEKTMREKQLELYEAEDGRGKYLAMDRDYNTRYKFDLSFSDSAFLCHTLVSGKDGMRLSHSVNIPWTDGKAIREFFDYLKSL